MGKVHQFRKQRKAPPLRQVKWKSPRRTKWKPPNRKRRWSSDLLVVLLGLFIGGLAGLTIYNFRSFKEAEAHAAPSTFACAMPLVVDGDTIRCGSIRVRLAGIDAPELPGHCRPGRQCAPGDPYESTENLARLVAWGAVTCRKIDTDHYGRMVAICSTGEVNLSCQQLRDGQAIRRYGDISC